MASSSSRSYSRSSTSYSYASNLRTLQPIQSHEHDIGEEREEVVSDVAEAAITAMSYFPSSSSSSSSGSASKGPLPKATTHAPIEIWDASTSPPTRVVSRKAPGTTDPMMVIHDTRRESRSALYDICFRNVNFINNFFFKIFNMNVINTPTKLMKVYLNSDDSMMTNNSAWMRREVSVEAGKPDLRESVIFGIHDPSAYNPLALNLEITAHEFGHAMIYYSSNFVYGGQSGALHEHGADVIGIMAKHYRDETTAAHANWLIGEGILKNTSEGTSFRSMSNPGSAFKNHRRTIDGAPEIVNDKQPSHMKIIP